MISGTYERPRLGGAVRFLCARARIRVDPSTFIAIDSERPGLTVRPEPTLIVDLRCEDGLQSGQRSPGTALPQRYWHALS